MQTFLTLNDVKCDVVTDRAGNPLISTTMVPASGQKRIEHLTWRVDGPDFHSQARVGEYLGRHYGANTDGRWDGIDCLGPLINTVNLATYDVTHSVTLLGTSTSRLGISFILGAGVDVPSVSTGVALMYAGGVWYAYIIRGQIPAKVRLSDHTLLPTGLILSYDATDIISTRNQVTTNRREISIGQGDTGAYQVLKEDNVGSSADTWAANASNEPARIFGAATDRTLAMANKTVKGNVQSGTATMTDPSWQTVGTIVGEDTTFTGFVLDGNLWIPQTQLGPYVLDPDTGDFVPLMPEIDSSPENGRQAGTWYPIGAVIPLRSGTRYSKNLSGESWGVETFLKNSSPVQGYATGGAGSVQWYLQNIYNEITGDTYIVAWRPRRSGDSHPNPLSPHVIAKLTGVRSRWLSHIGTLNGALTYPEWIGGNEDDMYYFREGRTSRWIDDTGYQFASSGTTYLTEVQLDEIGDIEAFEFHTLDCSASKTVQIAVSINRATAVTVGSAVTSDGFQRVLATSAGVPQTTVQGGYLIRPEIRYSTNTSSSSPKVLGWLRMRLRIRPRMLKRWTFTVIIPDEMAGNTNEDLQEALETAFGSGSVLLEDPDGDSAYVTVDNIKVIITGGGAGSRNDTHDAIRQAEFTVTEWQTAA